MFRSLFLSFVLLVTWPSYSMPVVLKAPQTPLEEFSAYVQTEDITSYAQKELEKIQDQSNSIKNLRVLLEQAQKSFLKDHLHQSGDYFRSIVKMAYDKDWVDEAKKIIFYSFLRLAQIEWKGLESEAFLYSAYVFAPHLEPDADLFPPPLIQKFYSIRKNQPKLSISLRQIFPFHEVVLINGRKFSNSVELPYGEYRMTALSSSHKKWSRVISLSQLVQQRIITTPLVSGSCQHPIFAKHVEKNYVLFPKFCLWDNNSKIDSSNFHVSNEIQKNVEDLQNTSHNWNTYKKWGAVAVIVIGVAAVVVILTNDKAPAKKPKLKKGFP